MDVSKLVEQEKVSKVPQYADDVFEGTGIVPDTFNTKLVQLEDESIKRNAQTVGEEAKIIQELFTHEEAAFLAVLMNRNCMIYASRYLETKTNLDQQSELLARVINTAEPLPSGPRITEGGIILPNG